MILSREAILKEIEAGRVVFEPFDVENVGPASVDLTLDNKFRFFRRFDELFDAVDKADFDKITDYCEVRDRYVLKPGDTILAITKEKITLPDDVCGWLQGRSGFARLGLMIHITASFVHPGVSNKQVLEISNVGPINLALYPGTRICQLVLQRCEGKAKYAGRFENQEKP